MLISEKTKTLCTLDYGHNSRKHLKYWATGTRTRVDCSIDVRQNENNIFIFILSLDSIFKHTMPLPSVVNRHGWKIPHKFPTDCYPITLHVEYRRCFFHKTTISYFAAQRSRSRCFLSNRKKHMRSDRTVNSYWSPICLRQCFVYRIGPFWIHSVAARGRPCIHIAVHSPVHNIQRRIIRRPLSQFYHCVVSRVCAMVSKCVFVFMCMFDRTGICMSEKSGYCTIKFL